MSATTGGVPRKVALDVLSAAHEAAEGREAFERRVHGWQVMFVLRKAELLRGAGPIGAVGDLLVIDPSGTEKFRSLVSLKRKLGITAEGGEMAAS